MGVHDKPCEKCKANKWKTRVSGKAWQCRGCGLVRGAEFIPAEIVRAKPKPKLKTTPAVIDVQPVRQQEALV